jgi:gamma-glutamylcyclotransferase
MQYFAYGSNLWRDQMYQRCPDHTLVGAGCLTGYRWIITSRGYASIVKSPQDQVLGLVYQLSEADEQELDRFEGVQQGSYYKQLVTVQVADQPVICMTYIDPVTTEGKPPAEYVHRINRGIINASLPPEYVNRYLRSFVAEEPPEGRYVGTCS